MLAIAGSNASNYCAETLQLMLRASKISSSVTSGISVSSHAFGAARLQQV